MHERIRKILVLLPCFLIVSVTCGQSSKTQTASFPLDSVAGLELVNAKVEAISYRGRTAIHLGPLPGRENSDEAAIAILKGSDFKDGTIEVEVAGAPRAGAAPDLRGFIGILFRVQSRGAQAEDFYLRPTNGRSDDQLGATTPSSTSQPPISPGTACEKKAPEFTNPTLISIQERGPQ